MDKRLIVASIVVLIALVFVFAGQQKSPVTEQQIKSEIEKANYCETKSDCVEKIFGCPFGCGSLINVKEVDRINNMVSSFPSNCKYTCARPYYDYDYACANNKCEVIYKTTGIRGTVTLTTGDCMPAIDSKTTTCKRTAISRTVYIREPATSANMDTVPNYNYLKIKTNLVKQIVSDANGYFEVGLPAGAYSVFVEDEGKEYCGLGGGLGEQCQVTVTDSGMVEFNININKATY